MNSALQLSDEVAAALTAGRPVVALESTIISHGQPRPRNHAAAVEFESILRDEGVTPATIVVLDASPASGSMPRACGVSPMTTSRRRVCATCRI